MSEGQHWAKQCPQLTLQDRAGGGGEGGVDC